MSALEGSSASYPAIACITMALSSIVQVSGPVWSSVQQLGRQCARLTRPKVALRPCSPQAAAGRRIEPPVSEPSENIASPAGTEAPAPVEEPPVKRSRSQGLRATGKGRS